MESNQNVHGLFGGFAYELPDVFGDANAALPFAGLFSVFFVVIEPISTWSALPFWEAVASTWNVLVPLTVQSIAAPSVMSVATPSGSVEVTVPTSPLCGWTLHWLPPIENSTL